MDFSQILIVLFLYYLVRCIYKNTEWHTKSENNWRYPFAQNLDSFLLRKFNKRLDDLLISLYAIFFGLPFMFALIHICISGIIEGTFHFLERQGYLSQIIFWLGVIVLYFSVIIYWEWEKLKAEKIDSIIESQKKTIRDLEKKIKTFEEN